MYCLVSSRVRKIRLGRAVSIDLVTLLKAILMSRRAREKLQCLYKNLMSNNFRKTAVLKKKNDLKTKATQQRIILTNFRGRTCA